MVHETLVSQSKGSCRPCFSVNQSANTKDLLRIRKQPSPTGNWKEEDWGKHEHWRHTVLRTAVVHVRISQRALGDDITADSYRDHRTNLAEDLVKLSLGHATLQVSHVKRSGGILRLHSPCGCLLLCYLLLNLCLSHFSRILRRPRFTPPTDFFLHSRSELQTLFFSRFFRARKEHLFFRVDYGQETQRAIVLKGFFRFFLFCFGLVFDTLLWWDRVPRNKSGNNPKK